MARELMTDYEVRTLSEEHDLPVEAIIDRDLRVRDTLARVADADYHDELVDDLVDYSGVATWVPGDVVAAGQDRVYHGTVWTSIAETSLEPGAAGHWTSAAKFSTPATEDVWRETLGKLLACVVVRHSLVPLWLKVAPSGVIKRGGMEFAPVSRADMELRLRHLDERIGLLGHRFADWSREVKARWHVDKYGAGSCLPHDASTRKRRRARGGSPFRFA